MPSEGKGGKQWREGALCGVSVKREAVHPSPDFRTVKIPAYGLQDLEKGRSRQGGKHLQLLLRAPVEISNGEIREVNILVDTGAQANLIREGLVPHHLTQCAKRRLQLIAANGQVIPGGEKVTSLHVAFAREEKKGGFHKGFLRCEIHAYVASIDVDMILSYPWLKENKIGLFPHLNALALVHANQTLLRVVRGPVEKTEVGEVEEEGVHTAAGEVQGCRLQARGRFQARGRSQARRRYQASTCRFQTPRRFHAQRRCQAPRRSQPQSRFQAHREVDEHEASKKHLGDNWVTERYMVKKKFVEEIVGDFGNPSIEAFADPETHLFPVWWGEGGVQQNAFDQSWDFGKTGLLWMNPPFSMMDRVVEKIKSDMAQCILICPK